MSSCNCTLILSRKKMKISIFIGILVLACCTEKSLAELNEYALDGPVDTPVKPDSLPTENQCPYDVSRCENGLSFSFKAKKLSFSSKPSYLLSSGGQNPLSNGFFVREEQGQMEAAVAVGDRIWKVAFNVTEQEWFVFSLSWSADVMKVYVDRNRVKGTVTSRPYVPMAFDPFRELTVGKSNDDIFAEVSNFAMYDLKMEDRVWSEEEVMAEADKKPVVGCVEEKAIQIEGATTAGVGACRNLCQQQTQRLFIYITQPTKCFCLPDNFLSTAQLVDCNDNSLEIHSLSAEIPLKTDIKFDIDVAKTDLVTDEDVKISMNCDAKEDFFYQLHFGDGNSRLTDADSIFYHWKTAGKYTVYVEAKTKKTSKTSSFVVEISERDTGKPPVIIETQASQELNRSNVHFYVTTSGTPPLTCNIEFGDGKNEKFDVKIDQVTKTEIEHIYELAGFYDTEVSCGNKYATKKDSSEIVVQDTVLRREVWDLSKEYKIALHGASNMRHHIQVFVDGPVDVRRTADALIIKEDAFPTAREYDVEIYSGESKPKLLKQVMVDMQSAGVISNFSVVPVHGLISDNYAIQGLLTGSPLFIELSTNSKHIYFYTNQVSQDFDFQFLKPYETTGMQTVSLKVCNEILCDAEMNTVSVETPINNVKFIATDVYSKDDKVRFQISPNLNSRQSVDRLQVQIDFGDGNSETKFFMSEPNEFKEFSIWHKYSQYKIYRGWAVFSNNVSSVRKTFTVQVGQNMTFVDLTTSTERLNTAVSSEAVIRMFCPLGSTRQYALDLGDGTLFTYPDTKNSQTPHGIPSHEAINDGDITVRHTYTSPGYYKVKVNVSNDFGEISSTLCPDIIVAEPPEGCRNPEVSYDKVDHTKIMERPYSENITLNMIVRSDCSSNATALYTWRIQRRGANKDLIRPQEPCVFRQPSPQLYLEPFQLSYGEYWIKGCAELPTSALYYACLTVQVHVTTSPLRARIAGGDRSDINMPDPIIIDITGSGDPDVQGLTDDSRFYLICAINNSRSRLQELGSNFDDIKKQSEEIFVDELHSITFYDFEESCFKGNSTKHAKITLKNRVLTIPVEVYEDTVDEDYYIRLITSKLDRNAILDHRVVIWDPDATDPANFDANALDDLLEKDVSGALFLITATAGHLNVDEDEEEVDQDKLDEKKAKAMEIRAKMIESLEKVASGKAENPSQVLGCAKALTSVTSKADEVTQDAKDKAANSLEGVANMTDGKLMNNSDILQVSEVTGSVISGVSNLLPGKMSEEDTYQLFMKQQERKEKSQMRKRRSLGETELMVEESEVDQDACGVNDEDWAILKMVDKQRCPWIHPYFTNKLANQRRAEKRAQMKQIRDANKKITKKCTGATKGVGGAIMKKQEEGKQLDFSSPNLEMKIRKPRPGEKAAPLVSDSGGIETPEGLEPGAGMMFAAMPNNPFLSDEGESGVTGAVVGLDLMGPDGKPLTVKNSKEPFKIEIPNKNVSTPLEFGMFTSIEADKKNFHSVNITKKDQHMRLFIKPDDVQDVIQVCYNLTIQPNETYPGFCQRIPRVDSPPVNLDPGLVDNWRHTVIPPFKMTKNDNVTLKLSIKLIGARVVLPIKESYHNYSFLTYNLACRYYNETEERWMDNGCSLSVNSTANKTVCLCNHLTSFGGDFVVPPNTIDFSTVWAKFANLNENAAVFSTVISVLCLYLIILVWARYKDKQDVVKWGAKALEDNLPTDSYHYQVTVHTGMRKGASTRSRISFVLSGDDSDTGVRELYDGERKLFNRGSVMNFVLSVEQRLGPLTFLRIWHDNKGKGKYRSWYLDHVQVNDLQTGERFFFICNRWLAVEEDDGMVERIIPVAGYDDMASFTQLFNTSVKKKLTNEHIWFSIVSRPTRSSFTRVQRLSCCLSLLFLTMITSCMWFKTGDQPETKQTAITLGPFSFTLQEVFVSFMSTMIVFPVNLLMVSIFRKVKAKKNTVSQQHQQVNKSKKQRWRRIDPDSALWTGQQKSKTQKFKDSMKNIITFHRQNTNKYSDADNQLMAKKKKKPFLFPHWMLYVAYILCFLSVIASAFFTILYSMEWGAELANKWLATFILSFFESVIIVQPIKVLLLAAFISFIMRKPELDDEQDFLDETMCNVPQAGEEMRKSTVDLEKIVLQRKTAATHLRPPDLESLREAREQRLMELKMEDIIKEMSAYMFFVLVLFFLSYQTRSKNSYGMGFVIKDLFTDGFDMVSSHQKFYDYTEKYLIPNLYPKTWYNTNVLKWREAICINDGSFNTVRVGVPRIRQMRVKPDTCRVHQDMRKLIKHCRAPYGWLDDDTKPYLEGWVEPPEANVSTLKKTVSPWVYRNSLKLKNEPYMATISTYKGGGYAVDLGIRREDTETILGRLYNTSWLDTKTRAVFIEFTLYNANVNLFTSVRMTAEFMSGGGVETRTEYKVFRLYSYVGGMGVIVLIAEIIFIIFFLYFFYREAKRLKNERWMYFKNFWNLLEFATMVGSITAISMYIMKKILAELAMKALRKSGSSEFVNFNTIALWDELYVVLLALLVFIATIKIIKILKFNRRMGILGSTIKRATKDLKVFSIAFLIYFFAFCQLAYLLFGREMGTYGNFVGACESMFAFALGDFAFEDMQNAQRYLGPIFFFLYIGIVYFVLMGIFLTIINDAFVEVKAHAELQSNDFELVDFMVRRVKGMFGCVNMGKKQKEVNSDDEEDAESQDTVSMKSSKL